MYVQDSKFAKPLSFFFILPVTSTREKKRGEKKPVFFLLHCVLKWGRERGKENEYFKISVFLLLLPIEGKIKVRSLGHLSPNFLKRCLGEYNLIKITFVLLLKKCYSIWLLKYTHLYLHFFKVCYNKRLSISIIQVYIKYLFLNRYYLYYILVLPTLVSSKRYSVYDSQTVVNKTFSFIELMFFIDLVDL